MRKYNVAIIGCGAIFKMHADAVSNCSNTRLAAVVDTDGDKANKAALDYGCKSYTDYREMLKDENIDAVHICTPHYLHAPMAVDAMKSGKHVLTEKPMATTASDALDMIKTADKTGKVLGVCFQNRYNTTSVKIKEILQSGKAGKVLGAKASVTWHRNREYYSFSNWRGTWDKEGGGVLINQAIHTLDLLQWFLGDIHSIKGSIDTRLLKDVIEVEDTAEAIIKFDNGVNALFYATNCYPDNSPVEIEIVCENALIKLSAEATVKYKDGLTESFEDLDNRTGAKSYWGCGHAILISDFYSKLSKGQTFKINGNEGKKALDMLLAIYKASKTGEYVKL